MKRLILLCLFCSVLASCSKEELKNGVWIRIDNQTSKRLDNASIFSDIPNSSDDREVRYGTILSGKTSAYHIHFVVPEFPMFTFYMQDVGLFDPLEIRCGMGGHLPPGKYSLIVKEESDYPYFDFKKD